MTKNNTKELTQPCHAMENPEAKIQRLEEELTKVRTLAEKTLNENQVLRASIKALASLL